MQKRTFLEEGIYGKRVFNFWEGFRVLSDSNYASYFTTLI